MPKRCTRLVLLRRLVFSALLFGAGHAMASSEAYLKDAQAYLAKDDLKAAVIQLKNALQSDPASVEARLLLGATYLRLADGPAAEKEFSRAGQLGAAAEQWLPGLGQALALQNNFTAVLEQVQPQPGMAPEAQAAVLALRGDAHLALQQAEPALQAYEQALALDPANPNARLGKARVLVAQGQRDAARAALDQLLQDHPELAEARVVRGELARQAGQLQAARDDFAKAIELAPNHLRAYIGHSLVLIALREPEAALKDVAEIRRRFGDMPFASYLHALAAFQQRDLDTAAEQLQLVLRAMPGHLQSQLLYGVVSYAKGDYQIAEEYLSRVRSAVGADPAVAKLLGATRLKLRAAARAIEVLQPAADAHPQDAQLLALLGNAYLQAGDNSKGSEYMAKAVELDPDQALLRTQLALGRLAGGDTEAAISELESAVELGQDLLQADVLLVLSYLNKQQHAKALEAAMALEQRMPDSPIPYNLTGLAYLASRDLEQADAKFLMALEKDPQFVVALMNRARLALLAQQPELARERYQAVLQQQPGHLGAMLGLAALAQQRGDAAGMEAWLTRAQAANPQALQPILLLAELRLRQGDALKALTLLSGLTGAAAEQPTVLRLRGMAQLQSGEFNSAVHTLTKLVESQPQYVEGWFQLARAQAAAGDLPASRTSFRKATALDAGNQLPLVWIGLGELELRAQDYAAALAVAQEMQQRFPGNAMAFEIEAAAQRGLGDTQKALAAVERAVRAEGTTKRVNLLAHSLLAAGEADRAAQVLRDWLAQHPDDAVSWTTLGMLLQQGGRDNEALAAYEQVLRLTPDNPVILNNAAWLYHQQGKPEALELAKRANEIAPERPEIVDTYGWILLQQGRKQEGLVVLQQALVAAPRNPEIGLHVAEALRQNGRDQEARPLLQRILREHPRTDWERQAQQLLAQLK